MSLTIITSPHIHINNNTSKIMLLVLVATLPAVISSSYFYGWGVLINVLLATLFCALTEAIILHIRKKKIIHYVCDYSSFVTAVFIGLSFPALCPWWLIFLAAVISMTLGKHVYGGLGHNPFNPAMVAYAMLLIARPIEMSTWSHSITIDLHHLNIWQTFSAKFSNIYAHQLDAMTMATPLELFKHPQLIESNNLSSNTITKNLFAWNATAVAYLIGGVFLIYKKVISWHIPITIILTIATLAAIFFLLDNNTYASPMLHLFTGATMFGAFFIATDPVSAPITNKGKIIFALIIALSIFIIRSWGSAYPDAIAFAVLLGNFCVATIDNLTKPHVYGHEK